LFLVVLFVIYSLDKHKILHLWPSFQK